MGRYCSYLLPKQDGGTSQIEVNPTKVFDHQSHPVGRFSSQSSYVQCKKPCRCILPDNDVLHVSPREVWVGLEGEGDDGGGHGGGGRGAGVLHRAAVVQVCRHDLPLGGRPGTDRLEINKTEKVSDLIREMREKEIIRDRAVTRLEIC